MQWRFLRDTRFARGCEKGLCVETDSIRSGDSQRVIRAAPTCQPGRSTHVGRRWKGRLTFVARGVEELAAALAAIVDGEEALSSIVPAEDITIGTSQTTFLGMPVGGLTDDRGCWNGLYATPFGVQRAGTLLTQGSARTSLHPGSLSLRIAKKFCTSCIRHLKAIRCEATKFAPNFFSERIIWLRLCSDGLRYAATSWLFMSRRPFGISAAQDLCPFVFIRGSLFLVAAEGSSTIQALIAELATGSRCTRCPSNPPQQVVFPIARPLHLDLLHSCGNPPG